MLGRAALALLVNIKIRVTGDKGERRSEVSIQISTKMYGDKTLMLVDRFRKNV